MGILEQITEMKRRGLSESEIINNLQQQRITPKEINDALSQAQIKSAITRTDYYEEEPSTDQLQVPIPQQNSPLEYQEEYEENPVPMQQENYTPKPYYSQNLQETNYSSQPQEYPQEEYYEQEETNYPQTSTDTDTIIEIAEQVSSEKTKELQKQIDKLNEFSTLVETRLSNAIERIKKIETTIDKLQLAVLDKVGSYGQNLELIKREMSMMQDSFSKIAKAKKTTKKR